MIWYLFDSNGEYKGESSIQTPLSTDKKPPECEKHQVAVWNGDKWVIMPDYRGIMLYSKDDPSCTYMQVVFGALPYGYTDRKPPELKNGEIATFVDNIGEWVKKCQPGWKYGKDFVPVPMNERELVEAGILILDEYSKIEGDYIVPKTPYELYNDGIITLDEANNDIRLIRENEYVNSTDKMYLMSVRGECTQQDWLDAIQAVKDKYPYIKEEENEGIS